MARLLIAGGTGLIGSEVVRLGMAAGHDITLICRQAPAAQLPWVQVDFLEPRSLAGCLPREPFDAVIYLAQASDHNMFPANASAAVALNIATPVAMCEWAVQNRCPQFIYASSGGICGSGSDPAGRITEEWPRQSAPTLNFYLSTKARCEELLSSFSPSIRLDFLRYFFVYGPGQRPEFLFPRLARDLRDGRAIELAQGAGPWMNPIHAADAAAMTLKAVGTTGDTITNIAGLEDTTLKGIVRAMERAIGVEAIIRRTEAAQPVYLADVSRMKRRLGSPGINLAEGISSTLLEGRP